MYIKSITLHEIGERHIEFNKGNNIIYSKSNSCGKTTLLRFILYALGYPIPDTKGINFESCSVSMDLWCEKLGDITLSRNSYKFIELKSDEFIKTYILPNELFLIHQEIFNVSNINIFNNLLGTFYMDQEKGWTLLNRGKVIGGISFNIEELVRGLGDINCDALIAEVKKIDTNLKKYEQMKSVAAYQETLNSDTSNNSFMNYDPELDIHLNELIIQEQNLQAKLDKLDYSLKNNSELKKYIDNMNLMIHTDSGDIIRLDSSRIDGLEDSITYLRTKKNILSKKISQLKTEIDDIQQEIQIEDDQLEFFKSPDILEIFDRNIKSIPMDSLAIAKAMEKLKDNKNYLNEEIRRLTKSNELLMNSIKNNLCSYMEALELNTERLTDNYLFTTNLKELSGAILQKTVFAFKLAYIKAVEDKLKIKLPIILDSPTGKEVDRENKKMMMHLLSKEFADNQIIIASIYDDYFKERQLITIKDRLIPDLATE